jgi:hypothetical protein
MTAMPRWQTARPAWPFLAQTLPKNGKQVSTHVRSAVQQQEWLLRAVDAPFDLNKIARQLNERPRKTLGFETPAAKFNACVAATG